MVALRNGNLIFEIEDDSSIDDHGFAKSINQMSCHLGSYNFGHSKRILNNFNQEIDGFYSNIVYYGDTDSTYIHEKNWSTLVDNRFVGKSLGLGKYKYGNAGITSA